MDDTKALKTLINKRKCNFVSRMTKCEQCNICDMKVNDDDFEDALEYAINLLLQRKADGVNA